MTFLTSGAAFALGFGFAFLPAYGPFAGLLFFLAARWSLKRSDLLWAVAALLLALPLAVQQGLGGFLFGFLQVLAPWLIYRTFAELHSRKHPALRSSLLGLGLLAGLAVVVLLGWLPAPIVGVLPWANVGLYGHTVFVLGVLIAIMAPRGGLRLGSLILSAVGVLLSGRLELIIAWSLVAFGLLFINLPRTRYNRILEVALLALMLAGGLPRSSTAATIFANDTARPGLTSYWQAAWQGVQEKPLWGWGQDNFEVYYQNNRPLNEGNSPTHAHNLPLQMLFERGWLGLGGLFLLLLALGQAAWRQRDAALLLVWGALLIANIFDYTLLYGGVLYPLAAVAGWRSASYRENISSEDSLERQLGTRLALSAVDFLGVLMSFVLALGLRSWLGMLPGISEIAPLRVSITIIAYTLLLWPIMFWREGLYPGYGLTAPQELRKQVMGSAYAGLILIAASVLFYRELPVPRSVLFLTIIFSMLLTPLGRALAKRLLLRLGLWGRPVLILGAGKTGQRVAAALLRSPLDGLHPVAFFDDDGNKLGQKFAKLEVQGNLMAADDFARSRNIRHAIVAIPTVSKQVLAQLIGHKGQAFKYVQFVPEMSGLPAEDVITGNLDGLLALEIRNGLHSRANKLIKRSIDLVGSVLGGVLIFPFLLAIYLWVRFDSKGSAFYWSERIGQNGKSFKCLKFRSMYIDADERLQEMMQHDPEVRREYELYHKLENDPRITKAGRFLRRYSLDELSQLYNVVIGEMSLIGPRPYMVREREEMSGYDDVILEAKPGMTGYWQVSGRSEVTFEERLEMESHYVRNWSIWWDVIILLQTASVVLKRRGAH